MEARVTEMQKVRVVRIGQTQSVEIPAEFELPGDEALVARDGDRLVIAPIRKGGLLELLATLEPIEEDFPDFKEGLLPLRDVNL